MNISEDFTRRVADDRFCAEVRQAVEEGNTAALERLGMRGFGRYAGRLAELIEESVRLGVDPDDLGFETLINELASPARYA
ncbi:MAG: hypothetical protein IJT87_12460, partial [Ruminiclostridium sp.]|nr:hypothetical protein [Ruminiclostridium sp.]